MSFKSVLPTLFASVALAGTSSAITIFGLGTGGQLYRFDTAAPLIVTPVGVLSAGGIVDIDFRGSNGKLYGLSATGATSTIDTGSGAITALFTPSASLGGNVTGFDFNPAADRMRIAVGGTTNFRMVPDAIAGMTAGTVVNGAAGDGTFALPGGVTLLDVAYTNPYNGGAGTTLYSIGSNGILYTHPAAGSPQFNTVTAVGSLGVALAGDIGFDISPDGTGYLVSGNSLYTVNLGTGAATAAGTLGQSLSSISVIPEPSSALLGAIGALGLLRRRRQA